jgi:hypothetical protein
VDVGSEGKRIFSTLLVLDQKECIQFYHGGKHVYCQSAIRFMIPVPSEFFLDKSMILLENSE